MSSNHLLELTIARRHGTIPQTWQALSVFLLCRAVRVRAAEHVQLAVVGEVRVILAFSIKLFNYSPLVGVVRVIVAFSFQLFTCSWSSLSKGRQERSLRTGRSSPRIQVLASCLDLQIGLSWSI